MDVRRHAAAAASEVAALDEKRRFAEGRLFYARRMANLLSARRHPYAGASDPFGLPPVRDDLPPKLRWAWAMARHLTRAEFPVETSLHQIVIATVLRSVETFTAQLQLLEHEQPAQAGMLARPLFEDLVVAHWVVYNRDDPEWVVERFFRHRDAIALHQERVERETSWPLGPKLPTRAD